MSRIKKTFRGLSADQRVHKFDEPICVHRDIDEPNPDQTRVANSRHQHQPRPAAGNRQHRRFPLRRVAARPVPVFYHCRLIAPADRRLFRLGPQKNRRIGFVEPPLDCRGSLLQGPLDQPLWSVTIAQQISPRSNRHRDPKQRPDQFHHHLPVPQRQSPNRIVRASRPPGSSAPATPAPMSAFDWPDIAALAATISNPLPRPAQSAVSSQSPC